MKLNKQLKQFVPGENYPSFIEIKSEDGILNFGFQMYITGFYWSISSNKQPLHQGAIQNDKKSMEKYFSMIKLSIEEAIKEGKQVVLGDLKNLFGKNI